MESSCDTGSVKKSGMVLGQEKTPLPRGSAVPIEKQRHSDRGGPKKTEDGKEAN